MANSHIVPTGRTELITGPATISEEVLVAVALTACAITTVVYEHPKTPATTGAVTALATFPILGELWRVSSFVLTSGTMQVTYKI